MAASSWPPARRGSSELVLPSAMVRADARDATGASAVSSWGMQPASRRADDTEAGLAGDLVAARRHVGGDVVQLVQDPPGPLDDRSALVGEPAPLAVDEGDTELLLEPGDVAADVGLHGVQRACSRRERPVVGDRHEGGELAEIHLETDTTYQ